MSNNNWIARYNLERATKNVGFSDLLPLLRNHFNMHVSLEQYLSPYNARQRSSGLPYCAPEKEALKQIVKPCGVNFITYNAMLTAVIDFCEKHKGLRALPLPHPSTIHSIQLPLNTFELKSTDTHTELSIAGVQEPLIFQKIRNSKDVKFLIVRPKIGKTGTPTADKWEVLLFTDNISYIPDWADTKMNTRYAGSI